MDCIVHGVAKSRTWLRDFHYWDLYSTEIHICQWIPQISKYLENGYLPNLVPSELLPDSAWDFREAVASWGCPVGPLLCPLCCVPRGSPAALPLCGPPKGGWLLQTLGPPTESIPAGEADNQQPMKSTNTFSFKIGVKLLYHAMSAVQQSEPPLSTYNTHSSLWPPSHPSWSPLLQATTEPQVSALCYTKVHSREGWDWQEEECNLNLKKSSWVILAQKVKTGNHVAQKTSGGRFSGPGNGQVRHPTNQGN